MEERENIFLVEKNDNSLKLLKAQHDDDGEKGGRNRERERKRKK